MEKMDKRKKRKKGQARNVNLFVQTFKGEL
jgi:hypothetical protein